MEGCHRNGAKQCERLVFIDAFFIFLPRDHVLYESLLINWISWDIQNTQDFISISAQGRDT